MPVFDDWEAAALLLPLLSEALAEAGLKARVLLVDDGSIQSADGLGTVSTPALERVDVLRLRRNVGHQRAIAIGLAYVEANLPCEAVVVMDSDGEDDPRDVPRLVEHMRSQTLDQIVFAERTRRSESWVFRLGYWSYCIVHRLLVGFGVRVGNFSVVPRVRLRQLTVVSELWNHYAAAVFRARVPFTTIPTRRVPRLTGSTKMNYTGLVTHGLSALSVHGEIMGIRLFLGSLVLGVLTVIALFTVVSIRLGTDLAIPGWASTLSGLLGILLFLLAMSAAVFTFVILSSRSGSWFLPARDYAYFVDRCDTVSAGDTPS
jgi:glycosyltransferase involved in cell wall biosynthesis